MADQGSYLSPDSATHNAVTRKLGQLASLSPDELELLNDLFQDASWVEPGVKLLDAGAPPVAVVALLEGYACDYQDLSDGRRQITAIRMRGELCGATVSISHSVHYHVRSLTHVKICRIPVDLFLQWAERSPATTRALQRAAAQEAAILRAWMINLGQRRARERLAHLLCELAQRATNSGLINPDGGYRLPLTQQELASALGMTGVHVNRMLKSLRSDGLIDFRNGHVSPFDLERLRLAAGFDSAYLFD